jgi:hypothetical protein
MTESDPKTDSLKKSENLIQKHLFDSLSFVMEKRTVMQKAIASLKEGNQALIEKNESQHYEIRGRLKNMK